jgi:hypothetical protein
LIAYRRREWNLRGPIWPSPTNGTIPLELVSPNFVIRPSLSARKNAWSAPILKHVRMPGAGYTTEQVERERIEREVYGWTTDDAKRNLELFLKGWRDTGLLTPDERSEFEALEARMPPREPDKSILAFERALSEAKGWRKNRP